MSKDNFSAGDKVYNFDINTIMKAIQDLSKNISNIGMQYISSTALSNLSDDIIIPSSANHIVIKLLMGEGADDFGGDLFLSRVGKTSSVFAFSSGGNKSATFTWNGDTLEISNSGSGTFDNATVYFYK